MIAVIFEITPAPGRRDEYLSIAAGLREFQSDPESNPGRGNVFELGGVTAIVDFAHNAHGMRAFLKMANAMPAARRLITLGMAGDRTDHEIREFA